MVVPIDKPIWLPKDDLLGRDSLAKLIAAEIVGFDDSSSAVIAITGPWGLGKTSLINLVEAHLKQEQRVRSVWFNPWLFSGSNELVERFFQELSAQLSEGGEKLKAIAETMATYGNVLTPLHSLPFIGGATKSISDSLGLMDDVLKARTGSVFQQQRVLRKKMKDLDTTILIVVDDIDRLEPSEMRDIFKLVRLTGDFPNLIYLLAFDRSNVESALTANGINGRDYIEKIVSIVHDVPDVPRASIRKLVTDGLMELLRGRELAKPVNGDRFALAYDRVISAQIRNVRGAKRFLASINVTLGALSSEVDFVDLITIESVRVFTPDLLASLSKYSFDIATTEDDINPFDLKQPDRVKNAAAQILKIDRGHEHIAESVLKILFPIAWSIYETGDKSNQEVSRHLANRRLAHRDIFHLYLNRFEGPFLAGRKKAEHAMALASNRTQLEEFLSAMEPSELESVFDALQELAENLPEDAVVPISIALLNLVDTIPYRSRRIYQLGPILIARRIVFLALINSEEKDREDIVGRIYPEVSLFDRRRTLIEIADNETQSDLRLTSKAFVEQLTRQLVEDFRDAPADKLALEPNLLGISKWVQDRSRDDGPISALLDQPKNAATLLDNSIVNNIRAAPDSDPRIMDVDSVIRVLGDRTALSNMMEICRGLAKDDEEIQQLLPIAEKSIQTFDKRAEETKTTSSQT